MATISLNLPLPVLNGPGAAVDVSAIGGPLTFECVGSFAGATIAIEISNDGGVSYSPLTVFQAANERVIPVAAQWLRANVSGRKAVVPFAATVYVAGPSGGGAFADLPLPVLNGPGAAVDTSAFHRFVTAVVTGAFAGASVAVQISEDNVVWDTLCAFAGKGGLSSGVVSASWMRAFVSGRKSAVPFGALVSVGAVELAGPDSLAGVFVEDEGVSLGQFPTMNFVGAGVTATDAGGGVAQIAIPGGIDGIVVEDEGASLNTFNTLNFVGGGVTATDAGGGVAQIDVPTPTIEGEDEGIALGQFAAINFTGGGVGALDGGGGVLVVNVPGGGGATIDVQDEAVFIGSFSTLNFAGDGVTAIDAGGGIAQVSIATSIQDEGVPQGDVGTLDFVGAGVTAAVLAGVATITIPGPAPSTAQVFRYTITGLEPGNPFTVPLPAARASANYNVQCQFGGPQANAFKDYRPLIAAFTNVQFDVECGAVPDIGDVLMFTVEDLT